MNSLNNTADTYEKNESETTTEIKDYILFDIYDVN
jgi:hypothetical protein